jgi:CBS domain-containing protein
MKTRRADLHTALRSLDTATARNLMTRNPRSIRQTTSVEKAAELMSLKGISGAPVIDEAGRPVGVVSRTDVLRHLGRRSDFESSPNRYDLAEGLRERGGAPVSQIMTRAVFSVRPETPAAKVIAKMIALEVRRLFVVDRYGVLIGVISAFDLLRHALPQPADKAGRMNANGVSVHALAS